MIAGARGHEAKPGGDAARIFGSQRRRPDIAACFARNDPGDGVDAAEGLERAQVHAPGFVFQPDPAAFELRRRH